MAHSLNGMLTVVIGLYLGFPMFLISAYVLRVVMQKFSKWAYWISAITLSAALAFLCVVISFQLQELQTVGSVFPDQSSREAYVSLPLVLVPMVIAFLYRWSIQKAKAS